MSNKPIADLDFTFQCVSPDCSWQSDFKTHFCPLCRTQVHGFKRQVEVKFQPFVEYMVEKYPQHEAEFRQMNAEEAAVKASIAATPRLFSPLN